MPNLSSAVLSLIWLAVPLAGEGWLGVTLDESSEAPVIAEVIPDSPAERAGLRPGDVVTAVDGEAVADVEALITAIRAHGAGDRVQLRIRRGEDTLEVTATLETRPGERAEPARERATEPAGRERPPAPAAPGGAAYVGVRLVEENGRLTITEVLPGGPAERAGLRAGARLVRFADRDVRTIDDVDRALAGLVPGREVVLRVARGRGEARREVDRTVELGAAPPAPPAAPAAEPSPRPDAGGEPPPRPGFRPGGSAAEEGGDPRLRRLRDELRALRREVEELEELLREAVRRGGR